MDDLTKELAEVVQEIIDLEPDDYGERIVPPGFLDHARTLLESMDKEASPMPECTYCEQGKELPKSKYFHFGQTFAIEKCGCEIRGVGLLPSPWHIHFCEAHRIREKEGETT